MSAIVVLPVAIGVIGTLGVIAVLTGMSVADSNNNISGLIAPRAPPSPPAPPPPDNGRRLSLAELVKEADEAVMSLDNDEVPPLH